MFSYQLCMAVNNFCSVYTSSLGLQICKSRNNIFTTEKKNYFSAVKYKNIFGTFGLV